MSNIMRDFKKYLQFLPPEHQIYEINFMINEFNKSNNEGENINKNFRKLNEPRTSKKEIMFNHKENSHCE